MIRHLMKQEVLNNISNFRFMVSCLIAFCLVILTTVILSGQYMKQVDQYREFIKDDVAAFEKVKVFSQLEVKAHRPPNPLVIFNRGVSQQLDNSVRITHASVPRQGLETESENPFMNIFKTADLVTIFSVVFSLLAILLAYDAISGEREDGTLAALLSNAVPRYKILLSKFLAGFLGISIALTVSMLISLLIMQIFYGIVFTGAQWLRIGLILFGTLTYLGFFLTLGLLVSSRTKSASISLIWLLFIWVFSVIVQPNLGSYLGSAIVPIPPREQLEGSIAQLWEEYREKHLEIEQQIIEDVPGDPWHNDQDGNWPYYFSYDGNRTALMRYVHRTQRLQPLWTSYAEKEFSLYQTEYEQHLNKQVLYQHLFNYLSPAALYNRISSAIAGSDIYHHDMFMDKARQFRNTYLSYLVDERKVFSENANLYFTHQSMEQIENSDYEERYVRSQQGEPYVSYGESTADPLDLAGLPEFSLQPVSVSQSVRYVLLDLALLLLIMVLLFYTCVVSFHQYDVRQNS